MALERTSLIELAKATAKASINPSATFSFGEEKLSADALEKTFRNELQELAATPALYRQNKNTIFELIEIQLTEALPPRILAEYGQFADVRTFAQGEQPVFYQKISEASRLRAKQFVTKVGLAELKSMTVEGFDISRFPTSITKSISSPICFRISFGFGNVSLLVRFALVVVIGNRLARSLAIL